MELQYLYSPDVTPEPHWLHNANSQLYVCLFGEACHAVSPGKKLDFLPNFFAQKCSHLAPSRCSRLVLIIEPIPPRAFSPPPPPPSLCLSLPPSHAPFPAVLIDISPSSSMHIQKIQKSTKHNQSRAWHKHQKHQDEASCWHGYMLAWRWHVNVAPRLRVQCPMCNGMPYCVSGSAPNIRICI